MLKFDLRVKLCRVTSGAKIAVSAFNPLQTQVLRVYHGLVIGIDIEIHVMKYRNGLTN